MKRFSFGDLSTTGQGRLLEKLEIIRTRLRLAVQLNRPEIDSLLEDCAQLRADILLLSQDVQADRSEPATAAPTQTSYVDLGFEGVLGESPGLLEALEIVRRAAPTNLPMLIEGESGTGKELFARVIHANSSRAQAPFISVNCGAIPENLIESELFGHKKGAFTGATGDRKGRFEAANGGTIFLDEVGELPLTGQVKLLRVLQAHEVQRVGSDTPISIDTRIVAATNRNLAEMAADGSFREDLFYRLSVIQTSLPPLRERRDEIPLLCEFFANQAGEELDRPRISFSTSLRQFLQSYHYPGNIRELRNLVFRLACLADGQADVADLPAVVRGASAGALAGISGSSRSGSGDAVSMLSLSDVKRQASDAAERRFLEQGLRKTAGRVVDLARQLDMNRSHLQTLLKKHGLRSKEFRPARR